MYVPVTDHRFVEPLLILIVVPLLMLPAVKFVWLTAGIEMLTSSMAS